MILLGLGVLLFGAGAFLIGVTVCWIAVHEITQQHRQEKQVDPDAPSCVPGIDRKRNCECYTKSGLAKK